MKVSFTHEQTIFNVQMKDNGVEIPIPGFRPFKPDTDINTQFGKHTDTYIGSWVQQNGSPHKFRFHLYYQLNEVEGDRTSLKSDNYFDFEVPSPATNILIGNGVNDARFSHRSKIKTHNWMNITGAPGLAGSHLTEVWYKIDGPGADDKYGNAGIFARVAVPISYELPSHRSFVFVSDHTNFVPVKPFPSFRSVGSDFVESSALEDFPEIMAVVGKT